MLSRLISVEGYMKTIAITAYNRPQYFEKMLLSLVKNDLTGWRVYIQLEPSSRVNEFLAIAKSLLAQHQYFIAVNETRLGVQKNPYSMLNKLFNSGTTACLYLEEDLIVSPDITRLANWYLKQPLDQVIALNLIIAGCNSVGFLSSPLYMNYLIKSSAINSLGLVFTKDQWEQHIKPNWLKNPVYAVRRCGSPMCGWDVSLNAYALSHPDLYMLQPLCARVLHIGDEGGVHMPKKLNQFAFDGLAIAGEEACRVNYAICDDYISLSQAVRSHLALWSECNEALITLKQAKERETKLIAELTRMEKTLSQQKSLNRALFSSKSWRLTYPLRRAMYYIKQALKKRSVIMNRLTQSSQISTAKTD